MAQNAFQTASLEAAPPVAIPVRELLPWIIFGGIMMLPSVRRPATLPHFPVVLHRGGYPDGS